MAFKHYRDRDHTGTQDDSTIVLGSAIGQYPAGTTLAVVLASLNARITALNSTNTRVGVFTINAFVRPVFRVDAVLFRAQSGSFTANAWFAYGGNLTLDSVLKRSQSGSFTMNAALV